MRASHQLQPGFGLKLDTKAFGVRDMVESTTGLSGLFPGLRPPPRSHHVHTGMMQPGPGAALLYGRKTWTCLRPRPVGSLLEGL